MRYEKNILAELRIEEAKSTKPIDRTAHAKLEHFAQLDVNTNQLKIRWRPTALERGRSFRNKVFWGTGISSYLLYKYFSTPNNTVPDSKHAGK